MLVCNTTNRHKQGLKMKTKGTGVIMATNTYHVAFYDVIDYWMTLFPEVNNYDEFMATLNNVSDLNQEDIEAMYKGVQSQCTLDFVDEVIEYQRPTWIEKLTCTYIESMPFYLFYEPLISAHLIKFADKLKAFSVLADRQLFLYKSVAGVVNQLSEVGHRTLVLEVNIARMNGTLKGGNTSEERFQYYSRECLGDTKYLKKIIL